MQHTTGRERILLLDVIRGAALLGIVLANMAFFKSPVFQKMASLDPEPMPAEPLDRAAALIVDALILGKFYPMFSLLFGLGFYLFMTRLEQRGLQARSYFQRRLTFLLLLGLIHLVVIWSGDILFTYALGGFFLLFFVKKEVRSLVRWGIGLLLTSSLVMGLLLLAGNFAAVVKPDMATGGVDEAHNVMSNGTWMEIFSYRLSNEVFLVLFNEPFAVLNVLGIFLIGAALGKAGWFHDMERHLEGWKKLCFHAGWSGVLLTMLFLLLTYQALGLPVWMSDALGEGLNILAGPLLMLFYVSAAVLIWHGRSLEVWTAPFAAVGRMALTNYMMQSVVMVLIFNGYGLGFYGQISIFNGFLIGLMVYAVQVILSTIWMSRFDQGPLEKLWRRWTYPEKKTS
ncbi:DUF418 domain-containing protein [Alkalicoccus chagannorensis]|uniref:DUF418 domain-containing protein n=1 Tax=Alkalicoccus chagannorensis TaxID=427072 RepID=UPI00047D6CF7|nr:DUF418 domain-containing protein [Alkalicoccus chagannorensis]